MEHEAGKGEVMETGERLSQALIITRQATESRSPRKTSFNHPAARQQYESALGLSVLDHLQGDRAWERSGVSSSPLSAIGPLKVQAQVHNTLLEEEITFSTT